MSLGRIDSRRLLVLINGRHVGDAGDLIIAPSRIVNGAIEQRFVVTVPPVAWPRTGARIIVFDADRVEAAAAFLCDHAELHTGAEPFIRLCGSSRIATATPA